MFDCVLWINGESAYSFAESLSKIGEEINAMRYCDDTGKRKTQRFCDVHITEKVEAIKQWITIRSEDSGRLLIVIDDYNESACSKHVPNLLPQNLLNDKKLQFLVTSQCKDLVSIAVHANETVHLDVLPVEIAVSALKETARKHVQSWTDTKEEEDAAIEIAKIVGYLPLGLENARAFIRTRGMSLSRYLHFLGDAPENATIFSVYDRSCEEVFKKCPPAKELMNIALICAECPIPVHLFSLGSRRLPKRYALRKLADKVFKDNPISSREETTVNDGALTKFYDILSTLQQYQLVTIVESDAFTVHPFIRQALKRHQTEENRLKTISCLSTLLATVFEGPTGIFWRLYDRLFPHVMEWYRTMERMSDKRDLQLLLCAGQRPSLSGYFIESCRLLERCLTKMERNVVGGPSRREAEILHSLGSAEIRLGKLSQAVQHTMQALHIWQEMPDPDLSRKGTTRTRELYAEILLDLEEYQKAEAELKQTKTVNVRPETNSDHTDLYEVTSRLANTGRAYAGQGKHDKALKKFREAANHLENGDNFRYHLYQARSLIVLAQKNLESFQLEDFKKDYNQCLEILAEIEQHYNCNHRYYFLLCREIASLAVEENLKFPAGSSREKRKRRDRLSVALERSKISLEGHREVYKSNHYKVAKAAEVAARVCLLYANDNRRKAVGFRDAAFKCLLLAVRIWKDTVTDLPNDICAAITTKCEELQKLQNEAMPNMQETSSPQKSPGTRRLAEEALRALTNVAEDQRNNQTFVSIGSVTI